MNQPIAIQSWCYRDFKALPAFFEKLKETGVNSTELCGVHANFNDPTTWPATIDAFKNAGVSIVAIGVENMTGDPAKDQSKFDFCKAAGVPNMSITFGPELFDNNFAGLRALDAMIERTGIKVGIHNHGGYDWLGNDRILDYVFKNTKNVGLHMDTAWAIDAKQDPCKWVERFGNRLTAVHVKDFTYSPKRQPTDVVIGTGILDLPKLMGMLKGMNFAGPIVIEYEGDFANPVPTLKECVAKLKALM
jgi:inosose dehydratase